MNTAIEKKVGQNIRKLREKASLTQEMLSAKLQLEGCNITRSAVAKIEVGQRHLYPDEIILIKKFLKLLTMKYLILVNNNLHNNAKKRLKPSLFYKCKA